MLNEISIFILFLAIGLFLGALLPGLIGYMSLLYRRVGFSLKLLTGFLGFFALAFIAIAFVGMGLVIFGVPEGDGPYLAMGLGTTVGLIGGCIVLFVRLFERQKADNQKADY